MTIFTWTGLGRVPGGWIDPLNWTGGLKPTDTPQDGDAVVIAAVAQEPNVDVSGASLQSLTVNLGASVTVGTVTFITTSVINDGTITGTSLTGDANGVRIDTAAASLTNSGIVNGDVLGNGAFLVRGGVVTNTGTIKGGAQGVQADLGLATITNSGTISGGANGLQLSAGGSITNSATGVVAGTNVGVLFLDTGGTVNNTLINGGTISGSSAAVEFGAGDDLLRLLPGNSFIGQVDGGAGTNTLELTAGSGPGQVAGLGTKFTNFNALNIDAGAHWVLAGTGGNHLGGVAVSGFAASDTIDLTDLAFNSVTGSFSNNTLSVANGVSVTDTLHLVGGFASGDFHFSSDGSGGTSISLAAAPGTVKLTGSHTQYAIYDSNGSLIVDDKVVGRDGLQSLSGDSSVLFSDGTGLFDPTGTAADVSRLYHVALGRAPDLDGLRAWTADIDGAIVPFSQVANDFTSSPEFIQTYGSLTAANFVTKLYQNALGRAPDNTGGTFWQNQLSNGASRGTVMQSIAESQEEKALTLGTAGDRDNAEVYRLYQTAFNRAPDQAGEDFWASTLASGQTSAQIAQSFIGTAEFQQTYGGLTTSDFVSALYTNALHRPADGAGLASWTNALLQGASQANVIIGFSDSAENRAQTATATHDNWVFIHA